MVNPWLTMVIDSPRNPASPDGSPSHPPPLPDPPDPLHFPPLPPSRNSPLKPPSSNPPLSSLLSTSTVAPDSSSNCPQTVALSSPASILLSSYSNPYFHVPLSSGSGSIKPSTVTNSTTRPADAQNATLTSTSVEPSSASVEELPSVPAVSSIPPLGLATDTSPPLGPAVISIDLFPPSSPTPVIISGNSDPPSPSDSEMVDLSSTDPPSFILALLAPFHDRHIPSTPPTIPASIPPLITATSFNPFIPSLPSSNSLTLHLKPAQSFSVISNKNPFAPLALDLDTFPETSSVASASPPSAQGEARSNL
ncbi:unnamed protein product [Brassica napus]|uniref:(rape) hypothetical protein n=1 Tax=Brassica napus TaxID=3708 RepID=A0A816TC23_BRANA|nr:unnamed protein product [Brassica napus]